MWGGGSLPRMQRGAHTELTLHGCGLSSRGCRAAVMLLVLASPMLLKVRSGPAPTCPAESSCTACHHQGRPLS